MRVSCNGCRVLRKGCSADCSIRPCLQWIKSPQAQANATVFLAKFYGRAGLMNLIDAGSEHLRPDIFRSLLYEACGRMVNPVYGSTGLLWSGSWHQCQAAVEAVLRGAPIPQVPCETVESALAPPLLRASAYDIRHVTKEDATDDHQKGDGATRIRVKRSQNHCFTPGAGAEPADAKRPCCAADLHDRVFSGNGASEPSSASSLAGREKEKAVSVETAEASMMTSHGSAETAKSECRDDEDGELELELTLGFRPPHQRHSSRSCSSSGSSRHSRAHSPTRSSADSAAAKAAAKNCDGQRMGGLSCLRLI